MCGRYIIRVQENAMKDWHVHAPTGWMKTSYNVAPTHEVPVVRMSHEREGAVMRWGLIPFFARGEPPKYATINARVETVETAPSYKGAWSRSQRCIQVTSGFYEWHVRADGRKVPYYIHLADQDAFGFASLWDRSRRPDGTWVESCALITLPANPLMHDIHNGGNNPHRMPAILRKEDHEVWLSGSVDEAKSALRQYPSDLMVAWPVGPRVNKPENDDEKLLEPATEGGDGAGSEGQLPRQQPLL